MLVKFLNHSFRFVWFVSKSSLAFVFRATHNQDEFEKRIVERDSLKEALGDDVSSHESDNIIFLDVVGGVNKKGRIYGLGPEAGKYKLSRSSRSDGILQSEFEQMRAENTSLKDQLKAHEELICASQEDSCLLREQMTKLMEMFSQGHPPPPPPSPPPPPPPPPPST